MIKNKKIILPFLLLAWTIIFAHSVIPHHHHNPNDVISHCEHNHNAYIPTYVEESFHDCDHDCSANACHFHVDVLTKINIDNDFIISFDFQTLYNLEISNSGGIIFNQNFTLELFPKTKFLRGPPQIA